MDVRIVRQPHSIAWSENPMVFTFAVSPFNLILQTLNLQLRVTVAIEQAWLSNDFEVVKEQVFYLNASGMVNLDVSTLIDPFLVYFIPPVQQRQPLECPEQTKRYKLQYTLVDENLVIVATQESDIKAAIKGGLPYEFQNHKGFFTDTVNWLATGLGADGNLAIFREGEQRYLYFLARTDADYTGETKQLNAYNKADALLFTHEYSGLTTVRANRVYCVPVSPSVLLPMLSYSTMAYLTIDLIVAGLPLVRLNNDARKFYDTHIIVYRNSQGGLDTITLRGQADYEADYARQRAEIVVFPDSVRNGYLLPQQVQNIITETYRTKADTGFITKERLDSLRDMWLSEEVYEYKDGRLMPALINNSNVKFYTNRDKLFSALVEFEVAWTNTKYGDPELLGEGIDTTCPAVASLIVTQLAAGLLEILYALEAPYEAIEIEINNGASPATIATYRYLGQVGRITQAFNNIGSSSITVRARTVCNAWSDPEDLGPYTTQVITTDANKPPVAMDDTFNINGGFTSPFTIPGTVLSNDYDPDGNSIEVVPATGTTAEGGTYAIDSAGVVTYTPPSGIFSGQDYFDYTLVEVDTSPALSDTGRVFINVGTTNLPRVYVRMVLRNTYYKTLANGGSEYGGERWLYFYQDPGGRIPLNVANRIPQLVVNVQQVYTDFFGTVTTTTIPVVADSRLTKFYEGIFQNTTVIVNTPTTTSYVHTIIPSADYVIIT